MPRSTSQTSPRPGIFLLLVKHLECDTGALLNVILGQGFAVELSGCRRRNLADLMPQFLPKRPLVADWQCPNLFPNSLRFSAHALPTYPPAINSQAQGGDLECRTRIFTCSITAALLRCPTIQPWVKSAILLLPPIFSGAARCRWPPDGLRRPSDPAQASRLRRIHSRRR